MQPNIDEIMPACQRVWMSEDSTGHRYMAQITDGANGVRWLVPLPRKEWEHLWGAIIKKRPDLLDDPSALSHVIKDELIWFVLLVAGLGAGWLFVKWFGSRGNAAAPEAS